jgi:signal transduction histidine kinase
MATEAMEDRHTPQASGVARWVAAHPSIVMAALMAAMLLAVAALRWTSSADELRLSVQTSTQAANETLTRVFANEHWNAVRPLLPGPDSDAQTVRDHPGIQEIDQIVRRFSRTTDVLKVKIYRLDGMTVYSSERAQIGEDKSGNLGFQSALRGQTVSELTTRGRFGGFDGEMYDRDLVSSYVPLRQQGRIEAVLEIYSDRTDSIALLGREVRQLGATLLPVLVAMLVLAIVAGVVLDWMNARLMRSVSRRGPDPAGAVVAPTLPDASHIWTPGVQQPVSAACRSLAARLAQAPEAQVQPLARDGGDAAPPETLCVTDDLTGTVFSAIDTLDELQRLGHASDLATRTTPSERLHLDELLQETVDAHSRQAASKGLSLSLYKYPQPLGEARADVASVRSLLRHLLGSAVDATREGRIEVKATRTAGGLRVDVIDSSPGLAQSRIDGLCAAWDTGVLAAPQEAGLAGLRLVLCHALARQLGGRTEFRSTQGHGSRLTAEIPLAGD